MSYLQTYAGTYKRHQLCDVILVTVCVCVCRFVMTQRSALRTNGSPEAVVAATAEPKTTPTSSDGVKFYDDGTNSFFW